MGDTGNRVPCIGPTRHMGGTWWVSNRVGPMQGQTCEEWRDNASTVIFLLSALAEGSNDASDLMNMRDVWAHTRWGDPYHTNRGGVGIVRPIPHVLELNLTHLNFTSIKSRRLNYVYVYRYRAQRYCSLSADGGAR